MSRRAALDEAERRATNAIPGNQFMRSMDYLCGGTVCPVFDRGSWLYTDTDHLSFRGAEPLSVPIEKALRAAAARQGLSAGRMP